MANNDSCREDGQSYISRKYIGRMGFWKQTAAWRRINRIASAIGEADVRKAIDEISNELL